MELSIKRKKISWNKIMFFYKNWETIVFNINDIRHNPTPIKNAWMLYMPRIKHWEEVKVEKRITKELYNIRALEDMNSRINWWIIKLIKNMSFEKNESKKVDEKINDDLWTINKNIFRIIKHARIINALRARQ